MAKWDPTIEVDEGLARSLIEGQFDQFRDCSLRFFGEGWDNSVWLVDEQWVFRFPRRKEALDGFRREMRTLPKIAPLLSLEMPVSKYFGVPEESFPWPFCGSSLVPGFELGGRLLDQYAEAFAGFLRELHSDRLLASVQSLDLPHDPFGRMRPEKWISDLFGYLDQLEVLDLFVTSSPIAAILRQTAALPSTERKVLCHGDLHLRHILLNEDETQVSGVIDWGDVCLGDPAMDLCLIWSSMSSQGRERFLASYGEVDEGQMLRARALGIYIPTVLALYAEERGFIGLRDDSVACLRRATED